MPPQETSGDWGYLALPPLWHALRSFVGAGPQGATHLNGPQGRPMTTDSKSWASGHLYGLVSSSSLLHAHGTPLGQRSPKFSLQQCGVKPTLS